MDSPNDLLRLTAVNYERRLVAYFDVLGWRSHIDQAGSRPEAITILRLLLQMFSIFQRPGLVATDPGAYLTSFSDNVVASVLADDESIPNFLAAIGGVQVGAACLGFFIRGAVTIGALFHDREIVFGPALNRAYLLENERANFPRVILDNDIQEFENLNLPFIAQDNNISYINPFTADFIRSRNRHSNVIAINAFCDSVGMNAEPILTPPSIPENLVLMAILQRIRGQLHDCSNSRVTEKLSWLEDAIYNGLQLSEPR